jgi:hypothetical protein
MRDREKRWITKHQLLDSMHVLHRPIEFAVESGHAGRPLPRLPHPAAVTVVLILRGLAHRKHLFGAVRRGGPLLPFF